MRDLDFKYLYFDVEDNTIISTDLEPAITRDHVDKLVENIETLRIVLGITDMVPMGAGSTVKRYKTTVTKGAKQPAEGDIIPLSKVERKEIDPIVLELNPYRKLTTAQAIQRVGQELALTRTDDALVKEIQKDIRDAFFEMITADTATAAAGGSNLQEATAKAWSGLTTYFEDKDGEDTIFFINPTDAADYLGAHNITLETAFGLQYFTNFLGLGTAIVTPRIPTGSVYSTVSENLNGIYIPQNGDVGNSFDLTSDETGLVGMTHGRADDRASIQTLILTGVTFYVEDASGIIVSNINA